MVKVSVIIPVYNTEKYLRKCLDSVCAQTLQDIEIICVNDCSTDDSLQILQEYAKKDSRIKLIDFEENKGVAIARNTAIDEAKGEYIGFVDSDDYIDLDFYEKLYGMAAKNNAYVVKGKIIENRNGRLNIPTWQVNSNDFLVNPAKFIYGFSSAIYQTDFIQKNDIKFPENIISMEDPYFTILAIAKSSQFDVCNNAKYYYRIFEKKQNSFAIIRGVSAILELINDLTISKEHYLTIFKRIYNIVLSMNNMIENGNEIQAFLNYMQKKCIYKNDFMLFLTKKIRNNLKNIEKESVK